MRALITGAAGFIGSSLADALIARGDEVVGIDAFTDYYAESLKRSNLADSVDNDRYQLIEGDMTEVDLASIVESVDIVYHQAAQPGVRKSWGTSFDDYTRNNVLCTQLVLEAVANSGRRPRVVYASSSSVYGNADSYPTFETDLPRPHSPYGVTKLAAEHLCCLYAANFGVDTVSLRYFTVYGPRQRPDMSFHRLCEAALGRQVFPLYGDGSAVRDFTYIADAVAANVAASTADLPAGSVVNIAGGSNISMREVIDLMTEWIEGSLEIDRYETARGDVARTGGSTDRARELLGWEPAVSIEDGLRTQLEHHRDNPPT